MNEKKHWTDYTALFVAVLALGLSVWSARETRIHDRLSVKPHIGISSEFDGTDEKNGIYLNINGAGPAVITDFNVFIGGTEVKTDSLREASFIIKNQLNLDSIGLKIAFPRPGIYNPGEKHLIIGPARSITDLTLQDRGKLAANFSRLRFVVSYESLYEEKFSCEARDIEVAVE